MNKIIELLEDKPVIVSGRVCDKKIVIDNLKAGAAAICSTNHEG